MPAAQQGYTSVNYSQVVRELLALGVNVVAQLVAVDAGRPGHYSLACNPEVTLDLLPRMRGYSDGRPTAFVGQVNSALPYMAGDAELPVADFDFVLDGAGVDHSRFSLPNRPVTAPDDAAGFASTLLETLRGDGQALGAAGREFVRAQFDWGRNLGEVMGLLRRAG